MSKTKALQKIQLVVDQPRVQAGSKLTGRLVLPRETSPEEKATIKGINIIFEGLEETQVTRQEYSQTTLGEATPQKRNVTYKEKRVIYSKVLVDATYGKGDLAEMDSLGFQMDLPSNLASSASLGQLGFQNLKVGFIDKRQVDYGKLSYKIKVTLKRRGMLKGDLKFDKTVEVAKKPTPFKEGNQWQLIPKIDPKSKPKRSIFSRDRGKIFVAARLPTGTRFQMEHILPVDVSVINDSTISIKRVEVSLIEVNEWKAKGHGRSPEEPMTSKAFGWLGDSVMNPAGQESAPQPVDRSKYESRMKDELANAKHRLMLTVPDRCNEDFQGVLMGVRHLVRIQVFTNKGSGPPSIDVPVTIYPSSTATTQGNAPTPTMTAPVVSGMPEVSAPHLIPQSQQKGTPACGPSTPIATAVPVTQEPVAVQPVPATTPPPQPTDPGLSFIEHKVGKLEIWQNAPIPQTTGVLGWLGKTMLKSYLGVDPYAIQNQITSTTLPYVPAPATQPADVSVATFLAQLTSYPGDPVSLAKQNMQQPASGSYWRGLFTRLSPSDFGDIVGVVSRDALQAPLAECLVPLVQGFSCQHLIEAIRRAHSDGVRNRMLMTLSAYCVDIKIKKRVVFAELNEDEQAYFTSGIRNGRNCG